MFKVVRQFSVRYSGEVARGQPRESPRAKHLQLQERDWSDGLINHDRLISLVYSL
jgi:hypothetical protein